MNTTQTTRRTAFQPLVSTRMHIVAALAVVGATMLVTMGAAQASHTAVQTCAESFSRTTAHYTLEPVQVVGRRDAAQANRI